jgi:anti-anti-sigma regulatory factor
MSDVAALIPPPRLVAETRSEFRRLALAHVAEAAGRGETSLVIDLGSTVEVDASGLGLLLFVNSRAREHAMTTHLVRVPPQVRALLELTKLEPIFAEVSS